MYITFDVCIVLGFPGVYRRPLPPSPSLPIVNSLISQTNVHVIQQGIAEYETGQIFINEEFRPKSPLQPNAFPLRN